MVNRFAPAAIFSRPVLGFRLSTLAGLALLGSPLHAQNSQDEHVRVVKRPVVVVRNTEQPVYAWSLKGSRAFLGVQSLDLTPELRQHFGVPEGSGVMISKVTEDSPAAASGIEVGDILTAVDGEPIASSTELAMAIGRREIGTQVAAEIWRNGELQSLAATLAEHEGQWVDIRQFHLGEDHPGLHELPSDELEGAIEIETELFNTAIERLNQTMSSPEWHERVYRFQEHQGDLMKRIETLEQRLRELERELEDLPSED